MFHLILKAIITGFILSVMMGPVFFVLIETSIRKGARGGIALNLGVFLSDILYIAIALIFYKEVSMLTEGSGEKVAKTIGGLLFIVYGLINFFKKPAAIHISTANTRENMEWGEYGKLCLKGFILNLANPMVIFYWFSVLSMGDVKNITGLSDGQAQMVFILVILGTFFSVDILKIFGAKQLRSYITPKLLKALNQLIGIVFVTFGIFLLMKGTGV